MTYDYDLIVIGSGAGGSVAAHIAAKSGKSVAVIESEKVGGQCPNSGCIPTKALLQAAKAYESSKQSNRFGVRGMSVGFNYPSVKAWKDKAVKRTGTYLGEEIYTSEGINLVHGSAYFIDPHTITVGAARFSSKNFLIATGSEIIAPPIEGLSQSGYLTYKEAINLTRPPKNIGIIGGGATGCEFAALFAAFGSKVYLIDSAPRLLMQEDPEVSTLLAETFSEQYKMAISTESKIEKIEKSPAGKKLAVRLGAHSRTIAVDEILLSCGKKAVVDIGLENAGVAYENGIISVDAYMQTSAQHIYAAGDCTGNSMYTHLAAYQSRIAAHNLLHPKKPRRVDYHAIPRCIFVSPEIAAVGATEQELSHANQPFKKAVTPLSVIGRANTADFSNGFVKVLADPKSGTLLGASIVCPNAGEMIHELTLAIQHRLTAQDVAQTLHAFPTWSEAIRVACNKLA